MVGTKVLQCSVATFMFMQKRVNHAAIVLGNLKVCYKTRLKVKNTYKNEFLFDDPQYHD